MNQSAKKNQPFLRANFRSLPLIPGVAYPAYNHPQRDEMLRDIAARLGVMVKPVVEPRIRTVRVKSKREQCAVMTKRRQPCTIDADRNHAGVWYCHLHDPDGAAMRNWRRRV